MYKLEVGGGGLVEEVFTVALGEDGRESRFPPWFMLPRAEGRATTWQGILLAMGDKRA